MHITANRDIDAIILRYANWHEIDYKLALIEACIEELKQLLHEYPA